MYQAYRISFVTVDVVLNAREHLDGNTSRINYYFSNDYIKFESWNFKVGVNLFLPFVLKMCPSDDHRSFAFRSKMKKVTEDNGLIQTPPNN